MNSQLLVLQQGALTYSATPAILFQLNVHISVFFDDCSQNSPAVVLYEEHTVTQEHKIYTSLYISLCTEANKKCCSGTVCTVCMNCNSSPLQGLSVQWTQTGKKNSAPASAHIFSFRVLQHSQKLPKKLCSTVPEGTHAKHLNQSFPALYKNNVLLNLILSIGLALGRSQVSCSSHSTTLSYIS